MAPMFCCCSLDSSRIFTLLLVLAVAINSISSSSSSSSSATEDKTSCAATPALLLPPLQVPTISLRNGVQLPVLSLGTAHVILDPPTATTDGDELPPNPFLGFLPERNYRQVQLALEQGIRSIDSGRIYRSHRPIGHVLGEWFRMGQLERQDLFLTTKVFHGNAERVGTHNSHLWNLEKLVPDEITEKVTTEVEEALIDLGVGYIDLLLLHWPASALGKSVDMGETEAKNKEDQSTANRQRRLAAWKVLEEFYDKGWLRAIGVSNFSEHHLEQLKEDGARILPMVNQIEASLSVEYPKIVEYCREHDILVQAFSPLKRGQQLDVAVVSMMAEKYDKSPAQISLRYLYQKGYAMTFLSTNAERMASNHDIFDFEVSDDDMEHLSTLPREDGNWGLPTPYDLE
jgi:diketogulonate reductase-like aldo/keto reductase